MKRLIHNYISKKAWITTLSDRKRFKLIIKKGSYRWNLKDVRDTLVDAYEVIVEIDDCLSEHEPKMMKVNIFKHWLRDQL